MSMRSRALKLVLLLAASSCVSWYASAAVYSVDLAHGQLDARAFGLFTFTIDQDVSAGRSLVIDTSGSGFDTEIAVYDALGRLVATNDDASSSTKQSRLSFGAAAILPTGTYTVVLSGFNTVFGDGKITPGSGKGGSFRIGIESTVAVRTPSAPGYLASDGNILPSAITETELANSKMLPGDIQRFDFVLENDILYGDWLAIVTTGAGFDSEIGLYDAQGRLLATNDDVNPRNTLSRLSFGLDGDNGRRLSAGSYTLLVGGFNTIFRDGFEASTSSSWRGDFGVYVQSSQGIRVPGLSVPEPASIYLAWLGVIVLLIVNGQPVFDTSRQRPAHYSGQHMRAAG